MIDPKYLIDYLRSQTAIVDAVGTINVNGKTGLPIVRRITNTPLAPLMPRRAIAVKSAGGPAPDSPRIDITTGRMDVQCYGETIGDAWYLHGIVYEYLRYGGQRTMGGQRTRNGQPTMDARQVITIRPTAGGIDMHDRDTDWPFVWMEYTMTLSEGR